MLIEVILPANAANALMVSPAFGEVIEVKDVPWCKAALEILASRVDHCVAVTVSPAETAEIVFDWP